MKAHDEARDWIAKWDAGECISSMEMGGIGPGYEQAIQEAVVAIVRANIEHDIPEGEAMPKDAAGYNIWGDDILHAEDRRFGGLTGAQAGRAKWLAYKILTGGITALMDTLREKGEWEDRHILISKAWPKNATT